MEREEAINWLKAISFVSDHHITEAMDMAIEALSAETHEKRTETHGVCSDLISRQAAVDVLIEGQDGSGQTYELIGELIDKVNALPSADREDYEKGYKDGQLAVMTGNDEKEFERGYRMGQAADRPTGEWIPVSERLPENIRPVIITWKNTDPASYYQYIVGKHFIGTGHYCNGKWFWYSSVCEDLLAEYGKSDIDELDEAIEVIAWMPLPEPYREVEE